MRMSKRVMGFAVLMVGLSLAFCGAVVAASSPKVGYFDLQTVLDQSKHGKQAREDFKREKDKIKSEMDDKAASYKKAKEELEKKKGVMDDAAKKKKDKEVADLQQDGEKFILESNAKLNKLSNELMAPIIDKTLEIVRKIGKDEKYDYIFEVGKGGLVWATDKDDITKKVTEELDKAVIPLKK